jgi:hypothetical protein
MLPISIDEMSIVLATIEAELDEMENNSGIQRELAAIDLDFATTSTDSLQE